MRTGGNSGGYEARHKGEGRGLSGKAKKDRIRHIPRPHQHPGRLTVLATMWRLSSPRRQMRLAYTAK